MEMLTFCFYFFVFSFRFHLHYRAIVWIWRLRLKHRNNNNDNENCRYLGLQEIILVLIFTQSDNHLIVYWCLTIANIAFEDPQE